jgi:hypothetical protein
VLDLYWHFSEPGDTYLGGCLAGHNPSSADSLVLPPHFSIDDPMSNPDVREAMLLMYGNILQKWGSSAVDPTALLLCCLASVVHHSDWLLLVARENPGHPFSTIPILNNQPLLERLKLIVTLEPGGQVHIPSDIPPRIDQTVLTRKALELCVTTLEEVRAMSDKEIEAVADAFEDKAAENGQLTSQRFLDLLQEQQTEMKEFTNNKLEAIKNNLPFQAPVQRNSNDDNDGEIVSADGEEDN